MELYNLIEVIDGLERMKTKAISDVTLAKHAQETIVEARLSLQKLVKDGKTLQEQYDDLLLLKEALGPKGVRAVAVDYILPQLEERINEVLSQMSDFRIRLDTQQDKVSEEGSKEGLFINIINDQGQEMEFGSYSGGERIKITMAISEALASLMTSIGFRILDEAINSLDNESTQSFVEVLLKLQEKFPQVIVISHLDAVKDIFEKKITVTKVNGISKIT